MMLAIITKVVAAVPRLMWRSRNKASRKRIVAASLFVAVVCLIAPSWAALPTGSNSTSVFRMNTGGGEVVDSIGRTWQADRYGTGGTVHQVDTPIAGTNDDALFQSERWNASSYDIPTANGTYTLQLLFAEINPSSGKRVMDISVNDRLTFDDFEISGYVGTFRASVQRTVVQVTDGMVRIKLQSVVNATSIAGIELLGGATAGGGAAPAPESAPLPQAEPENTTTTAAPPSTTAPPPVSQGVTPSMQGWKMVASDQFNGTSVDRSKWGLYQGRGNEGIGWRSPDKVKIGDGALRIVGQGDTAGGMAMKTSQTYGRWVIRAKMDKGNGYGPAILLWPDSERWPIDGEIDIAEVPKGARQRSHFTVHWGSDNKTQSYSADADFSQWHTWTMEWTADRITVWIDGKQVGTITDRAAIPDTPMHLALQNDVGAAGRWISGRDSSTPSQVALHVDYVQVYRKG